MIESMIQKPKEIKATLINEVLTNWNQQRFTNE